MEENDVLASESVALGYYSVNQLLKLYADVLVELKKRNVVRSSNNPVSDFCEWLVADSLGLTLQPNSTSGFDAFLCCGNWIVQDRLAVGNLAFLHL